MRNYFYVLPHGVHESPEVYQFARRQKARTLLGIVVALFGAIMFCSAIVDIFH